MYRQYEKRIQEWIDHSKKALLIYGARQVGKTYLIRKLLKRNGIPFFEINFQERGDILKALNALDDAKEISFRLSLYSNMELDDKSVIFLDEVQLYPEIVTKIKFLVDEGKYRFILSGSNLGVELKGIKSIPVGYVEMFQMYPMNLYEFALALGEKDETFSYLNRCFETLTPIDDIIHNRMITILYYYLICGGMPAVVDIFIKMRNLRQVRLEQESIIRQYKADFTRYEENSKKLKIISIYDSIPSQLNQQNRRFVFTQLNKELRFERYENSFLWLKDAAVAIPVYIVNALKAPLILSKSTNQFKLFMGDVGLLTASYSDFVSQRLLEMNPNQDINNGALFENFIAQELAASEVSPFYFKNKKIGEIDFVIEKNGGIVPLEIKSGANYKRHKAIDNLIQSEEYEISEGYVLALTNIEKVEGLVYLPIYMISTLMREDYKDVHVNLETMFK